MFSPKWLLLLALCAAGTGCKAPGGAHPGAHAAERGGPKIARSKTADPDKPKPCLARLWRGDAKADSAAEASSEPVFEFPGEPVE